MSQEPLEAYLEKLGHRGVAESRFTLDPRQALAKLGAFQMPSPGLWAVKLVQGAVAAGATQVTFTMRRRSLEFRCFGDFTVDANHLLSSTLSATAPQSRHEQHWITAMRAAIGKEPVLLTLTSCHDGEIQRVDIRDGTLLSSRRALDGAFVYHRLALRLEYNARDQAPAQDEFRELCQRCRLCPIPVNIDGRDIIRENLPYWTSVVEPAAPERPHLMVHVAPQSGTESFHRKNGCQLRAGVHRGAFFLGVALASRPQRPQAYWLRDGVLLGPIATNGVETMAAVDIVLPGNHCELDLSEWAVKNRDSTFPAQLVREAFRQLGQQIQPVQHERPPQPLAEKLIWGGMVMLSMLFGGAGLVGLAIVGGTVGWLSSDRTYGAPASIIAALRTLADGPFLSIDER